MPYIADMTRYTGSSPQEEVMKVQKRSDCYVFSPKTAGCKGLCVWMMWDHRKARPLRQIAHSDALSAPGCRPRERSPCREEDSRPTADVRCIGSCKPEMMSLQRFRFGQGLQGGKHSCTCACRAQVPERRHQYRSLGGHSHLVPCFDI